MRNVFEVLAAGEKGSAKRNNKTPQAQASSKGVYTSCPLCQRTVPLAFADAHVSACIATPRQPRTTQPGTGSAAPRHTPSPVPPTLLLRQSGTGQLLQGAGAAGRLNLTTQRQRQEQAQQHAEQTPHGTPAPACNRRSEGAPGGSQQLDVGLQPSQPAFAGGDGASTSQLAAPTQLQRLITPHASQQQPSSQAAPAGSQAAAPSAFDIMRRSQLRAASRCQTFFLEHTQDGRWLGHCWAKGGATTAQHQLSRTSCWSVTVSVNTGGRGGTGEGGAGRESLVLLTNVPPGHGGDVSWMTAGLPSNELPPEGRWRGGPSGLKSALQKAVRLGRGGCAVRVALHLAKDDEGGYGGGGGGGAGGGGGQQLLRRLSIICVEDAILHPGLPLCVWLMIAQSKGFVLGATHMGALLSLTYQLAAVPVRDGVTDPLDGDGDAASSGAGGLPQGPSSLHQVDELGLPPAEGCLLKCLQLRASYGGMACDVRMLRGFTACWAARFLGAAGAPPDAVSPCSSPAKPPVHPPSRVTTACGSEPDSSAPAPETAGDSSGRSGEASPSPHREMPLQHPGAPAGSSIPPHASASQAACGQACCDRPGSESGKLRASVASDAYFAARLQAEDAGPSCAAFMPASQLLAEAASEQRSLQRLATAARLPGHVQTQGTQCHGGPPRDCPAEALTVVPKWHAVDRKDADACATGGQAALSGAASSKPRSKWLAYLCDLYDSVHVPVPLSSTASVGPLRRSDVPLSAIDFHVSDVLPHLMSRPEVQAALLGTAAPMGTDAEDALKSAMWHFRSSKNPKAWIHTLSPCCRGADTVSRCCNEHRALAEQLAEEARLRKALADLWSAAAPWADRYSVGHIARRFGPP